MRRVGLTGTAVEDTIEGPDGVATEDMGGLYYALGTARALLPGDVRIVPILAVGRDAWERVRGDFAALPGVVLDGLVRAGEVNNKVRLVYSSRDEREETLTGGVPPLRWDDLEPWVERLDAWLWNFVAGSETDRETFGRVKAAFAGPIHMDVHSLCLEHPHGGPRRPRRPETWEEWVGGVTWLQCNEPEAGLLWQDRYEPLPPDEETAFAGRVVELGAEGVLISRGARGATWYPARGEPLHAPAYGVREAVDPTGCGDVLGAAWFALRVGHGAEVGAALEGAVRAAGRAAALRGTADLYEALGAGGGGSA